MIPKHILEADKLFYGASCDLQSLSFNPKNAMAAKQSFEGNKDNPHFEYGKIPKTILETKKNIGQLEFKNTPLDKIYSQKQKEMLDRCNLYLSLGTKNFTKFSKRRWGVPAQRLVNEAYDILGKEDDDKEENISSVISVSILNKGLQDFRLDSVWKILPTERISYAAVRYNEKVLSIKKEAMFSKRHIQRLVVHEIGTHILRHENSHVQPLSIFGLGLAGYLTTEEGLAVYNEYKNGLLSDGVLKQYAGRVIAVKLALSHSFMEVFDELKKYFDEESAFKLAFRAKRGLSDTSIEGGCTKDYVYLKGFYDVKEYLENEGSYKDLYVGKVGINDIPILERIPEIREPKFIPHEICQMSINSFA